jgi:hypothetical protein
MSDHHNQQPQHQQPNAKSPDVPLADTPPVWTSPSFWVTILPVISAIVGFFLHKQIDLSGQSAAIGLLGASLATGALAIARSMRHKALLEANSRDKQYMLDHYATFQPSRDEARLAHAFREIETDMRLHHGRLVKLEDAVKKKTVAKKTAAKKTTAKKTAVKNTARRTTALDMRNHVN